MTKNSSNIKVYPVRIIPVDIGYKIDNKLQDIILKKFDEMQISYTLNVSLFGEDALISAIIEENLSFYLFADGVGVFVYEDTCMEFGSPSELNAEAVLSERKNAHKSILNHNHSISSKIDTLVALLRGIVRGEKRRFTASSSWECNGLLYVMSFYFLDGDKKLINNSKVQEWIGNMLFTDKHTYFGTVSDTFEKEKHEQILNNVDILDDVHVCHSWATMIVVGKLNKEQQFYYINLEIVLQHIWMYTYITEQNIDMFLAKSDKKVSSQQLTNFYDTLIDMTLIVKKYDTIIKSSVHERELRIFEALKESSKLEVLKKSIEDKSNILESKLSWALDQKRLKSDRNTEIFIVVLTILQVLSGFGIGIKDISNPIIWISMLLCLLILMIYRLRD